MRRALQQVSRNPDTQELEFAGMRSTTLALPEQNGYPLYMVAEYVIDRYGRGHHVPGVEYLRWLHRNPGQSPANLKHHGSRHLFFVGSALHHGLGPWKAPCAIWDETEAGFFKWADEFSWTWGPDCRIVTSRETQLISQLKTATPLAPRFSLFKPLAGGRIS